MKKLASIVALVLALLIASYSCSVDSRERQLVRAGGEIIAKIESFKKENRRLPESLTEVGVEEKDEGPIYYERKSETKYVLWFGMELGESVTYDSESRKWSR
jgi:hypothetical protein